MVFPTKQAVSPTPSRKHKKLLKVAKLLVSFGTFMLSDKQSFVRLLATPWTAAYQAPPSMGFSKQECWSGVPLPSPTYYDSIMNAYLSIQVSILLMDALPSCGRLWVVHLPVA